MSPEEPRQDDEIASEINASLAGMTTPVDFEPPQAEEGRDPRAHRGTVVGVVGSDVFVELGPRQQGIVALQEFDDPPAVGTVFDFVLVGREEEDLLRLSRRAASTHQVAKASWTDIEVGKVVSARVTGQNTGGLEMKVGAIDAFMPASQVALHRVDDLSSFIGQTMECEILEANRARKRLLVSRRALLEAERDREFAELASGISIGEVVKGKVKRLESYGAFIEIRPGVEGLLHVSNISRKRIDDPSEVLALDQVIEAAVIDVKEDGRRIGLGMKQLEPDPWDYIDKIAPVGGVLNGKVRRIAAYGAFVEIADGIDGLLHISQLGIDRNRTVADAVKEGEAFAVRVLSVDTEQQRISLSRLDEKGRVLGAETEDAEDELVGDVLKESSESRRGGTNLGDLLKKALGDRM